MWKWALLVAVLSVWCAIYVGGFKWYNKQSKCISLDFCLFILEKYTVKHALRFFSEVSTRYNKTYDVSVSEISMQSDNSVNKEKKRNDQYRISVTGATAQVKAKETIWIF